LAPVKKAVWKKVGSIFRISIEAASRESNALRPWNGVEFWSFLTVGRRKHFFVIDAQTGRELRPVEVCFAHGFAT
jgi:hypothetical protein